MDWRRGSLSHAEAGLLISALPLEVSFADEHDVLRFWQGPLFKTCDARYVGRDVRDCHADDALECLEDILRQFKAGTRHVAEGWKTRKGRFLYTSYRAVRDADGTYRGILEVHQDLTDLRALHGEQALPGW